MDWVSPFDERRRTAEPLAPRPAALVGRRVVLLDISKARGDELLDRIAQHARHAGADVHRLRKPTFSRPAPADLIEEVAIHGDLVVEGLAD